MRERRLERRGAALALDPVSERVPAGGLVERARSRWRMPAGKRAVWSYRQFWISAGSGQGRVHGDVLVGGVVGRAGRDSSY